MDLTNATTSEKIVDKLRDFEPIPGFKVSSVSWQINEHASHEYLEQKYFIDIKSEFRTTPFHLVISLDFEALVQSGDVSIQSTTTAMHIQSTITAMHHLLEEYCISIRDTWLSNTVK